MLHYLVSHCGPLAQLGARHTGSVEVRGSNPLRSTKAAKSELFVKGKGFGFSIYITLNE